MENNKMKKIISAIVLTCVLLQVMQFDEVFASPFDKTLAKPIVSKVSRLVSTKERIGKTASELLIIDANNNAQELIRGGADEGEVREDLAQWQKDLLSGYGVNCRLESPERGYVRLISDEVAARQVKKINRSGLGFLLDRYISYNRVKPLNMLAQASLPHGQHSPSLFFNIGPHWQLQPVLPFAFLYSNNGRTGIRYEIMMADVLQVDLVEYVKNLISHLYPQEMTQQQADLLKNITGDNASAQYNRIVKELSVKRPDVPLELANRLLESAVLEAVGRIISDGLLLQERIQWERISSSNGILKLISVHEVLKMFNPEHMCPECAYKFIELSKTNLFGKMFSLYIEGHDSIYAQMGARLTREQAAFFKKVITRLKKENFAGKDMFAVSPENAERLLGREHIEGSLMATAGGVCPQSHILMHAGLTGVFLDNVSRSVPDFIDKDKCFGLIGYLVPEHAFGFFSIIMRHMEEYNPLIEKITFDIGIKWLLDEFKELAEIVKADDMEFILAQEGESVPYNVKIETGRVRAFIVPSLKSEVNFLEFALNELVRVAVYGEINRRDPKYFKVKYSQRPDGPTPIFINWLRSVYTVRLYRRMHLEPPHEIVAAQVNLRNDVLSNIAEIREMFGGHLPLVWYRTLRQPYPGDSDFYFLEDFFNQITQTMGMI